MGSDRKPTGSDSEYDASLPASPALAGEAWPAVVAATSEAATPRREIVLPQSAYRALAWGVLLYALYRIGGVLTPLFGAYAIAYLLDPLVDRLEARRIPRGLGVAIVMLAFLAALTLLLVLVIPRIVSETTAVIVELPAHLTQWMETVRPWLARYGVHVPGSTTEWLARLQGEANNVASSLVEPMGGVLSWVVGGTLSAFGVIGAGLIVPVFAIYLLYDFDAITVGVRDLTPARFRPALVTYAREIDKVLGQFVRGQLVIMLILAVLYGGAYTALGVRLAIPIGIVAGMLNFVPYLGSAFALGAGLLMSLIGGGGFGQLVGVVIAYSIIQSLEGFVITPRIVGKTVGLRDVWVLFALFVGGELFGFLGVLVALPAAAVAKIFVTRALRAYRDTDLFLSATPPVAPGSPQANDGAP